MAIQKCDLRQPVGIFEEHYCSTLNTPVFRLDTNRNMFTMQIKDDGIGMQKNTKQQINGIGLKKIWKPV